MADHTDNNTLDVIKSDLISPGYAAWFDKTGSVFCNQAFDSHGVIPPGRAHGVYVHPSSEEEFNNRLARGDFIW